MELTPRQEEARRLLSGPQRHTCLVGGSRSGKTFLIVRQILVRAIKAAESRHAILRLRYNAVKSAIWYDTLPKVNKLCFPDVKLKPYKQEGFVEIPANGSQIWMGGLDDKERVEKILGQEYVTIFFNECSQIPYASVVIARTRLAQNIANLLVRAIYDLNPTGKGHWTNRLFGEHKDPTTLLPLAEPEQFARMFMNPRDNAANLPDGYIESELESLPERQRRRFLLGVYVDEVDGALWTIEQIEESRCTPEDVPQLVRVVVGVDPSGTRGDEDTRSNEVGIVVAGLGADGVVYVMGDLTCAEPPAGWGKIVVDAWHAHQADVVVAEQNFGGEMVRFVIETADPLVPVKVVTASRGKAVRAEPVSALYEKGKVRHVGTYRLLEDQMIAMSTAGYTGDRSPDRVDALVWAVSELMVGAGTLVYEAKTETFVADPVKISQHWPRVCVIDISRQRFAALWAAWDRASKVLYLTDEYVAPLGPLAVHARAVRARGKWIPALFDLTARGRTKEEGVRLAYELDDLGVQLFSLPEIDMESGVLAVQTQLSTGSMRVFSTLARWLQAYRLYRRDAKTEELPDEKNDHMMRATAMIVSSGESAAITEVVAESDEEGYRGTEGRGASRSITGY